MPRLDMINVLSATCDDSLEDFIRDEVPNANLLGSVRFQDNLMEVLERTPNLEVLILSESLPGRSPIGKIIKDITESFPRVRIIFIMTSTNPEEIQQIKTYLFSKHVYDILQDNEYGGDDFTDALNNPKTIQDVRHDMSRVSYEEEVDTLKGMESINDAFSSEGNGQEKRDTRINYNNNIEYDYPLPQIVPFWSPKAGTGVDTIAAACALMLAKYSEVDVCVVDFSDNPTMHLLFNINDRVRNLENVYTQMAKGMLNSYSIEKFVINGTEMEAVISSSRLANFNIIPGAIFRMNFFKKLEERDGRETIGEMFENIINILREKYTIVIPILSSNISHTPTLAALRKATSINMILENDIYSFHSAIRHLDDERGMFNNFQIDKGKVRCILNKMNVRDDFYLTKFLKMTDLKVNARVGYYPEEIYTSIKDANPVQLFDKPAVRDDIMSVVNTITRMKYTDPDAPQRERMGLSDILNIFKKNKK